MTTELQAAESDTVNLCAETMRVRVLQESDLQQRVSSDEPDRSFDPYNTGIRALTIGPKHRKSLDDMRQLSEAIKLNRLPSKGTA